MDTVNSCEIICVGTELLLGEIVNTNAAFLSQRLSQLGINTYHQTVVGDNPERLADALRTASDRCDLIITSGGLGPTYDDLTKETVARVLNKSLLLDRDSLNRIEAYFNATGRVMTQNNAKQAYIPEGAISIRNDYGTAPGVYFEDAEHIVVMLPGPPNELEPMFDEQIMPLLAKHTNGVLVSHNLNIIGMGESAIESRLSDMMRNTDNPSIAPYAKFGEVRLRVTARAEGENGRNIAEQMCRDAIGKIMSTEVGEFVYGIDEEGITIAAIKRLRSAGMMVATAESCTGGLVAKRFTDIAGSSDSFVSGVVSYSNDVKMKILGVSPAIIEKHTEVSHECAKAMAKGVRELLGADVGLATTGYAGPGGGNENDPVGTVYIAISTRDGEYSERLSYSSMRDRIFIREAAATRAQLLILKTLPKQ